MATFRIMSADGSTVRYEGCPKYVGTYLKPSYLEFSDVCSPAPIEWQVGDYVDYFRTGLRYKLYTIPQATKKARKMANGSAFSYDGIQFFAATKDLEVALFRDLVPNDNGIHFSTDSNVSTFETVEGVARRIQACMDDIFPNRWTIRVDNTNDEGVNALMAETKEFSVSNGSCLSALEQIYQTWKNIGWSHTYDAASGKDIITIGATSVRSEANTTDVFAYGRRKGLSSLKKADANKDGFATRLYVYGSERNIQTRYYNGLDIYNADGADIRHLMIPPEHWGKTGGKPDPRKAYLQAEDAIIEKHGLIPRIVYFNGGENEEIYPSIKGITANELREQMIACGLGDSEYLPDPSNNRIDKVVNASGWGDGSKEDAEAVPTFSLTIQQVGFNVAEQGKQTAEGYATISFLSGACAGRNFKVRKFTYDRNERPTMLLEKFWDESIGMAYPNEHYPINVDDEFVILDVPMPDYYIILAQDRLYAKAQQMLADYTKVSAFYEPVIDPIVVMERGGLLKEGMYMQVVDEDVVENKTDYVLIDTININEADVIPTYNVTLREQKRSSTTFSSLKEMIEDAKYDNKTEIKKERQYVERRFKTAQETLDMLKGAIDGFDAAVSPITLQTMAILVGSQSLQFTFIKSLSDTAKDTPAFSYNPDTKIFSVPESVLMHYTIGQKEITSSHDADSLYKWEIDAFESAQMLDDAKAYYLFAFVPFEGKGEFVLTDTPRDFEVADGYNLLVGILNSATDGERDFAPLYGFTEVLPGQITTDVIRSADGKTYFDLLNGQIGGVINFSAESSGELNVGTQNLLRNSGFTGDYVSEPLADGVVMDVAKELFSDPRDHWELGRGCSVVALAEVSASGYGVEFDSNVDELRQSLYANVIKGETYVVSFKAKSTAVDSEITITLGGTSEMVEVSEDWERVTVRLVPAMTSKGFGISSSYLQICDIQLERGTIATAWTPSYLDNISDRAYYQSLKYLEHALNEGSTTIGSGLVLTNHIKVGNYANKEMIEETGGMQGTWTSNEDPFLWGGGDLDKAIATIEKYKANPSYKPTEEELKGMANFVVTHGGRAILNDIVLRGYIYALGGNIGDLIIKDNGIEVATQKGYIRFTRNGLILVQEDGSYVHLGTNCCEAISIQGKDASAGTCYVDEDRYKIAAQINAEDGYHAIHCLSGMYAGLRPNTRKIYEAEELSNLDHTLVVENNASITLTLPSKNIKGQTLKFIHVSDSNVALVVGNREHGIIDALSGSSNQRYSFSNRGTYIVTFCEYDWYVEYYN